MARGGVGRGVKNTTMLDGIQTNARWTIEFSEQVAFVGDFDGDGVSDVAVARPWTSGTRRGLGSWEGSVEARSGHDGSLLWTHYGSRADQSFGIDVAPAGDRNGDGVPDVVGLSSHRLAILSGVDGSLLTEFSFAPGYEMWRVRAVGDLDGDGHDELLLHEESSREYDHPLVYSSATWMPGRRERVAHRLGSGQRRP